ncbi:MAG: GNAT family N-acetyltransferase [Microcoleus sp. SIO2G3]|nr:GNAT family N-acetyltransferase [Microcoleus sp. SIO2G3]
MVVTETLRLLLRYFTWNDLNNMATIYADPIGMAFRGSPRTFEETQQLFQWMFDNYSKDGFEMWAIIHKADQKLIGCCGLIPQEVEGQQETEMGYVLAKEYWGQGLATEAAFAVRDYGFEKLGCDRIVALINPKNIASQNVARKIGLVYERDITHLEKIVCLYFIHKSSWLR